jgi:2-dehydro-3-deoxyphosphogluconate aldolase/(4S)-4-hydroxy-2-oxoglutarate aldolase
MSSSSDDSLFCMDKSLMVLGDARTVVEDKASARAGAKFRVSPGYTRSVGKACRGLAMLKAWQGPFGDVTFCPTGGIHLGNAAEFLALSNVACVGGSWIVPTDAIRAGDWGRIEQLARDASRLAR